MSMRVLLLSLLVLAGCDEGVTGPKAPLNTDFVLAPGQSVVVESATMRFVAVASDSRCPADVVCVRAGDAVVQIAVTSSGVTRDYELHTETMQPVQHEGLTILLVQLEPLPVSTRTIAQQDYRATLRVSR